MPGSYVRPVSVGIILAVGAKILLNDSWIAVDKGPID